MIKYIDDRLDVYRQFTRNPVTIIAAIAQYKLFGGGLLHGTFRHNPFFYRCADVGALKEVLLAGEYEFLRSYISGRVNPVILDIGHHIGTFSLWASAVNPTAKIFGVEADPYTYKVAARNAELAQRRGVDWTVTRRAAWNTDDVLSFSTAGQTMGHKVRSQGDAKVQGILLSALMPSNGGYVDLLKVDIEGAEERFLESGREQLPKVESLVVEIHPQDCSESNVVRILKSEFSTVRSMGRDTSSKPLIWCTR